jgi:hypothetical protein
MSRKSKTAKRPVATAMPSEQVRRIQELRRSSAASPQGKRPTRSTAKRQAINAAW